MQLGYALKNINVGEAIKTLSMGGYVYKRDHPQKASYPDYPYQLVFKNKDGDEAFYDMTEAGDLAEVSTPAAQVLSPTLLTQIAYGDWNVMDVATAESQRTNPQVW